MLQPASPDCLFFKQSRQSPFAEKLRNSPFTQLQARRFAVPPHIAHGKFLVISNPFRIDYFLRLTITTSSAYQIFVSRLYNF